MHPQWIGTRQTPAPSCLLRASVHLQLEGPEQMKGRTLATFDIPTPPGSGDFAVVSGHAGDARTPNAPFMVFTAATADCASGKAGGVVDYFSFVPSESE